MGFYGPSLVAVLGLAGAGKSSVAEMLSGQHQYDVVYFGGVVVEEVVRRGLPVTPDNEKLVREELRRDEGMDVMAKRRAPQIAELLADHRRIAIDGLYSWAELQFLRSTFDSSLVTLAVHCPRWLRRRRLASRPIRPLTASELDERDLVEVRNLDKAAPIATADLHIVNDSSPEELYGRISAAFADWALSEDVS